MREQQAGLATMMEGARWQARKEHVTSLFLERNCRVSALDADAVARALEWCRKGPVTLLFWAKDREHNQAVVLRDYLAGRL